MEHKAEPKLICQMNVKKQMKINQETLRFIRHCIVSQKEKRKKHSCVSSLTLLATTNYMANIKLERFFHEEEVCPFQENFFLTRMQGARVEKKLL